MSAAPSGMPAPREDLLRDVERVCVVLLTGLGDVVNGLPLVNALRDHKPGLHVTWVAEPMPAQILRPHPSVDEVVVYEKKRGWSGVLDLRRKLAGRRFDLTLNLNIYFKSVWPTLLSGAPRRMGFDRERSRDGVWLASNLHLEPRARRHNVEMFLEFAERLGVPAPPRVEYRIPLTPEERRAQEEFFGPLRDRPVVSLVPATSLPSRDWLPERYAEVVDALEGDFGFRTLLAGGPGERETRIAREISDRARHAPVWALGDGVRRLAWTVGGSDLVISPDTGPLHVARALEVPVIGLYGETNPWRQGPYGLYQDLFVDRYTNPGEAPDTSLYRARPDRMDRISTADVLERVERAVRCYGVGRGRAAAP